MIQRIEKKDEEERKESGIVQHMEKEPRAKYVGRISYAVVELCDRGYCDMRGWGIWLLAS